MRNKLAFLTFLSLSMATNAIAEEINALQLLMSSGKLVTYMLDEEPVITFEADELVMKTHMATVRYQANDVLKFNYISVEDAGIASLRSSGVSFAINGNVLTATKLEPNSEVNVYSADGKLIATAKTDKSGNVTMSLPLKSGELCLISTTTANFKITKP